MPKLITSCWIMQVQAYIHAETVPHIAQQVVQVLLVDTTLLSLPAVRAEKSIRIQAQWWKLQGPS